MTVSWLPSSRPAFEEALGEQARAARVLVVLGGVLAAGREVADEAACAR